jgi:hypothetical protein
MLIYGQIKMNNKENSLPIHTRYIIQDIGKIFNTNKKSPQLSRGDFDFLVLDIQIIN